MKSDTSYTDKRRILRTAVRQHDSTDCGAACLMSLIRLYGGDSSIQHIREISGTSNTGTTLLGLFQAANASGFSANGAEAGGIPDLLEHGKPCILAAVMPQGYSHYIVWYGCRNGQHTVFDPAKGLVTMTSEELSAIWTRKCLLLEPDIRFEKASFVRERKRGWMLALVKDDFALLAACAVTGVVMAVLGMVMSVFSQKLVDEVIPERDMTRLVAGSALVLILLLARVGVSALRNRLLLTQGRDFNNRIIGFFFGKLLRLPKTFFDTRKTGDMVARLNDTRRIQSVLASLAGESAIYVIMIVVSALFLLIYSWEVALAVIACMPLLFLIVLRSSRGVPMKQREVMASYAGSESAFINTIAGMTDIKGFARENDFLELNRKIYARFQDRTFSLGESKIDISLKTGAAVAVLQIALILMSCTYVLTDSMTTGELMAVLGITGILFPSVANLALITIPLAEAKVAFERMYETLDARNEAVDPSDSEAVSTPSVPETLETDSLAFRFIGRNRIFENISLSFRKGEITCIVGESGCGKSTLCQVLERFYAPEEGRILLDGTDARAIPLTQWRSLVSAVPQDIYLYNGTVLDNIAFGDASATPASVAEFCSRYGFGRFISSLPGGLKTLVGEEGISLSGGERQVTALLRTLYRPGQILILDELTSAMDRKTEKQVCDILSDLKKDRIIIFVTHRLETARRIADRIVVMESGHVTAQGTHDELLQTENFYGDYWKSFDTIQS